MPRLRSFRILWVALIPVLVLPLYGQDSCSPCPAPPNPCQRYAWVITTNDCVLTDLSGTSCTYQGGAGVCSDGQCVASECDGNESFGICDEPINGGGVGACIEGLCIDAVPDDECVKVGVGRINCCSPEGCAAASGAWCNKPLADGTPCDPAGIEPAGQPGQDGICQAGACVAQTGSCAGLVCRTGVSDPCARKYCDPGPGQCDEWNIESFSNVGCYSSQGYDGVCAGGLGCVPYGDPEDCGGVVCDDGNPCTDNRCAGSLVGTYEFCFYPDLEPGEPCQDGQSGQCFLGRCQPVFTDPCNIDDDCDDGNDCTVNTCETSVLGSLCQSLRKNDNEPCEGGQGLCRNGVCVPDLCIGRDCSDGDSCTDDVCISPYGICENPTKANGEPCDGEPGECIFGNCAFNACTSNSQCDDGNDCTINTCDLGSGLCSSQGKPSGAPCTRSDGTPGECRFGACRPVLGGF